MTHKDMVEIENIINLAEKLCEITKGDYVEDVWGEREERILLEQAIKEYREAHDRH